MTAENTDLMDSGFEYSPARPECISSVENSPISFNMTQNIETHVQVQQNRPSVVVSAAG